MVFGLLDVLSILSIGIEGLRIGDDQADRLGRSRPRIPRLGSEIRQDAAEEVEQLIGMLLLDIGELLGRGVSDDLRASGLEQPAT